MRKLGFESATATKGSSGLASMVSLERISKQWLVGVVVDRGEQRRGDVAPVMVGDEHNTGISKVSCSESMELVTGEDALVSIVKS